MRRHSRSVRLLKWLAAGVCLLAAIAWLGSALLFVRVPYQSNAAVALRGGGVLFLKGRSEVGGPMNFDLRVEPEYGIGLSLPWKGSSTWRAGGATSLAWYPLWPIFVLAAIPTALLWRLSRRPPLGHCDHCGYNLTGNVSGICPECGRATEAQD